MSLIEVMVGITVALIASLVVINAFSGSEAYKRTTTGASDAQQTAGVLSAYLSRVFQEAGSAIARGQGVIGCGVSLTNGTTTLWPRSAALDAPFDKVPQTLRMAPAFVVASSNAAGTPDSDTLVIMSGRPTASPQDYPATYNTSLTFSPTPAILFNPSDYLLAFANPEIQESTSTTVPDCQVLRVASSFAPTAVGTALAGYGGKPIGAAKSVVDLNADFGEPTVSTTGLSFLVRNLGAAPSLIALSRNDSGSLQQLNLLTNTTQTVAENIYAIKVLYGVDTDGNKVLGDADWVTPTSTWTAATLLDGKVSTAAQAQQILAVRIGIVVRSSQMVSSEAATPSVTVFPDKSSLKVTYNMSGDDARYQYQVYDMTVPLQNLRGL
ncbi:MAG: PilW family protein [Rhodocyclaceae bacterium]